MTTTAANDKNQNTTEEILLAHHAEFESFLSESRVQLEIEQPQEYHNCEAEAASEEVKASEDGKDEEDNVKIHRINGTATTVASDQIIRSSSSSSSSRNNVKNTPFVVGPRSPKAVTTSNIAIPFFLRHRTVAVARGDAMDKDKEVSEDYESVDLSSPKPLLDTSKHKQQQQRTIEASVFNFNQIFANTMYDTIGKLYPTSTNTTIENGSNTIKSSIVLRFEKFYVLETLSRIPFFAYLSMMHIKETFGDRGKVGTRDGSSSSKKGVDANNRQESRSDNSDTQVEYHANLQRMGKMNTHYAQFDNELHHMVIMKELISLSVGNSTSQSSNAKANPNKNDAVKRQHIENNFLRRVFHQDTKPAPASSTTQMVVVVWLAQCLAFLYYSFVAAVFLFNEPVAYHLGEVMEKHAVLDYDEFLAKYEPELRTIPVPESAKSYYEKDYEKDPFLFNSFCAVPDADSLVHEEQEQYSGANPCPIPSRRCGPHSLNSLYDVFRNIRDDEQEHWMALCNLVQYDELEAVDSGHVQSTAQRQDKVPTLVAKEVPPKSLLP